MIAVRRSWLRPWRWQIWRGKHRLGSLVERKGKIVVLDTDGESLFTASTKQEATRRLKALVLLFG